jgi:1,4-alpha-glucan branching enzyme
MLIAASIRWQICGKNLGSTTRVNQRVRRFMRKNGTNRMKSNGQTSQQMRVEFSHPTATAVAIAGSFNDWRPDSAPMVPLGGGRWLKVLALLPGTYEYLIVVDGKWIPDPSVKETVPNPFGGVNSFVTIPPRQE